MDKMGRPAIGKVSRWQRRREVLQLIIGILMIGVAVPWLIFGLLGYFLEIEFDRMMRDRGLESILSSSDTLLMIASIALSFVVAGGIILFLTYRGKSKHARA
jgi:hypothetical protein